MHAQTKHHAWIVRRQEASAANLHSRALQVAGLIGKACTDRVGIRLTPNELHPEPMILLAYIIAQQDGCTVVDADKHIDAAIVVEVPDRQAPCGERLAEDRPTRGADVLKRAALVMKQQERLTISHLMRELLDQIVGKAVGDDEVHVAVIVVVKKLQPPSAHPACSHANSLLHRYVFKAPVAAVTIKRKDLLIDVGDEQVHPAVIVEVGRVDAHTRPRTAVGAICNIGGKAVLFEAAATIHV